MFMTGVFELSSAVDHDKIPLRELHTSVQLSPAAIVLGKVCSAERACAPVAPIIVTSASAHRFCGGHVLYAFPLLVHRNVTRRLGRAYHHDCC
jgi:hypothetical protein